MRSEPLRYHPTYWSVVFPLGMYTLATYRFGLTADFSPLRTVSHVMVWVAFGAWAAATAGPLRSAARARGARSLGTVLGAEAVRVR